MIPIFLFSLFASTDGLDFRKLDTDIPYRGRELTYSKGYIDSVIENGLNIESFIDTRKARIEPPRGKFLTTFQNGLVIGNVSNLAVGDRQLSSKDSVFWSFSGVPRETYCPGPIKKPLAISILFQSGTEKMETLADYGW